MDILCSVVILTKNSMNVLPDLMNALHSQECPFWYEIIFMDNNSSDGTVEYLQNFQKSRKDVTIIHVPENAFSHSGTRMQAARMARGRFIVFLTDDVIPIGQTFLADLTAPVRKDKAAASYGVFQIGGKRTHDPIDAYLHNPRHQEYKDISEPLSPYCWSLLLPPVRRALSNFDNCASCVNKDVLFAIEFPNVPYGEDMIFAKRLILNNHKVACVKKARFYHWHKVKFGYLLKRMCIDQHLSIKEFGLYYVSSLRGLLKNIIIRIAHRTLVGLFKVNIPVGKKLYWIGYNMKTLTADFLGKYIGALDGDKTGGILAPLKRPLAARKKHILDEIEVKSLWRY